MSKKLSRSLLKEIVKECLVELLFEGIDSDKLEESIVRKSRKSQNLFEEAEKTKSREVTKKDHLPRKRENQLAIQAEKSISGLTDDPIMADIFADTARTTLVEQTGAEGRKHMPATTEAAIVDSVDDMEDLFGGASNWADIAFAGQKDY